HADDGGARHPGVTQQAVLDLTGGEVLAAGDDHVVGAALHEEVALLVDRADVAGDEPAVGIDTAVDTDVLAGDLWAPDADAAFLAGRYQIAVLVDDLDLDARQRPAHRRQPDAVAGHGRAVVLRAEQSDGRARLREAVGVDEAGVREELERPLQHGHGHAGAAVGQGAQARQLDA